MVPVEDHVGTAETDQPLPAIVDDIVRDNGPFEPEGAFVAVVDECERVVGGLGDVVPGADDILRLDEVKPVAPGLLDLAVDDPDVAAAVDGNAHEWRAEHMDVFDPDIPPARHIDRMLGGSLLPHRHLPVGQHAARDGKVFAVVELEAAVLFGVQQRRTGKIDLRAPEPFDFEQSPESEAAAAEAEGAAVFAQLRERGPDRVGVVVCTVALRAEVADVELGGGKHGGRRDSKESHH